MRILRVVLIFGGVELRISSVTLRNFRACRYETTVKFGLFSTIVGKNDVGKSTILHALDIFFNRNPDIDDFCRHAAPSEPLEITVSFCELPLTIELEDGVKTTFKEEHLVDNQGNLTIRKVWLKSSLRRREVQFRVVDFVDQDFQNLCSKTENNLNALGTRLNINFPRSGRGITNKDKRAVLRKSALEANIMMNEVDISLPDEVTRKILDLLPAFHLFVADARLSEEETPFQRVFRDMIDQAIKERDDRESIEQFIEEFIDQEIAKVLTILKMHTDAISSLKARPEFKWRDLVAFHLEAKDHEGVESPLGKRGTGIRRLLMVAHFQYLATKAIEAHLVFNQVYAIEEPESFLHPGAQRALLESFRVLSDKNQIIVTSHSPVFAGATDRNNLVWVRKVNGSVEVLQGQQLDLDMLATDLGIEPSDMVYGARACVFVESPDDILFLETVASKLKDAGYIPHTFADLRIAQIPVGGRGNLKWWMSKKAMRDLNRRYGVFVDSDRKSAIGTMSSDLQQYKQDCEADGAIFHATRKREIENYIHPEVVYRQTGRSVSIGEFDDVKQQLGPKCIGLVTRMTAEQILECDSYIDEKGEQRHELLEVIPQLLNLVD